MSHEAPRMEDEAGNAQNTGLDAPTFAPLPGEAGLPHVAAPLRDPVSKKGMLALVLLVSSAVLASAFAIQRYAAEAMKTDADDGKVIRDKPAAASTEPRKLDLAAARNSSAQATKVPALLPSDEELAEPIGVRRTGLAAATAPGVKQVSPEDAPVLLVSTRPSQAPTMGIAARPSDSAAQSDGGDPATVPDDPLAATSRNLQAYQRQLQSVMENLTRTADLTPAASTLPAPAMAPSGMPTPGSFESPSGTGLFGGQLLGSTTSKAMANHLGHRSLTLPKGSTFTCALKTRIVTASSGMVGCMVQRHVYGDDGRVLLIERGSHLDGEYRIATVRPGMVRIPVLWTRVRTPLGVTVDLDSPATGPLGESGIDGYVDQRWSERIGAAMLLSLIDDSVKLIIQQQSNDRQGDTIVLPSTTAKGSKLAEKVLDSTINIAPLIYQNQGGIVGIHVARDVDFSRVYALEPTERARP